MKKLITILMAASILFAHGCAAKTETETTTQTETTTTAVQQIETTQPETTAETVEEETTKLVTEFSHSFKKAYYEFFTNDFSYLEHEITDSENNYYTGILFADLFDWNLDGVPELMIGYSLEDEISYNAQYLDIYTVNNGKAELVLRTYPHASYGALDGSQSIGFARGEDGTLYLGIDNEETEEMTSLGETYYTFKDGKVEYTRFYAEMDVDWDNGAATTFRDFRIDGKNVTEKQFNNKRNEMGIENTFYAILGYCEYDMLFDYLAGETETYTNQFFSLYDDSENHAWADDVDFGYKMTFTK